MRIGLIALGLWVAGCNPYRNLDGDFYLGAVDATKFPDAYLGAGFAGNQQVGTFVPSYATVAGGGVVAYYPFPAGADPLTLDDADQGGQRALLYVFDGDSARDTKKCTPPSKDYVYDVQRDYVRFDRQGNVFEDQTAAPPLPSDPAYQPVYAEVPVTSNGEGCQTVHSAEGLVKSHAVTVAIGEKAPGKNQHAVGKPDGTYLAAAMIDPRAIVLLPDGTLDANGMGAARYGFYNHYLAAYIEGGEIPVETVTAPMGDQHLIVARPATLYAPNTVVDAMGNTVSCDTAAPTDPAAPCIGLGFDLIAGVDGNNGARGEMGYSPICSVRTFTPADPAQPPSDPSQVDPASLDPDSGTFVYCLQVAE